MGAATSEIADVTETLANGKKISPYFVPRLLPNLAAGHVSMAHDLRGPILTPATACASGAHAIGDAMRLIREGIVDVAICGGTESTLDKTAIVGFARMKALTSRQDPTASRPFDVNRDGFVMSEGAAVLVLESEEFFNRRASTKQPYAEIVGVGMSGDAYHVSTPSPDGRGAEASMKRALHDCIARGGVEASKLKVGYVNAHATSTPIGDVIEANAVSRVFPNCAISSTKGATGHLLGAAGALEAMFTILSLRDSVIPGTMNIETLDKKLQGLELDFVHGPGKPKNDLNFALSNSFGFGGTNVSLVFKKVG